MKNRLDTLQGTSECFNRLQVPPRGLDRLKVHPVGLVTATWIGTNLGETDACFRPTGFVGQQEEVNLSADEDPVFHVQEQAAHERRGKRQQFHTCRPK